MADNTNVDATHGESQGEITGPVDTSLVFREIRVMPKPVSSTGDPPKHGEEFEYAEHMFLGDQLQLKLESGGSMQAQDVPFDLPNSLRVTYGQINGLAGDFYGTTRPISDGYNYSDRAQRLKDSWVQLAEDTKRQPREAKKILDLLQSEVNAINRAVSQGTDPSVAYSQLKDITLDLQAVTMTRPSGYPSYVVLAQINWDHFGDDARTAYNTGHRFALEYAATPGSDLRLAYAKNAFADHFLEDSFSAGHLRTPRRVLHGSVNFAADLCAKFMHDEDCAIGISVQNPKGDSFQVYGDKRLLDKVNIKNRQICQNALQASCDEIYYAWRDKKTPSESSYGAWNFAPTLDSCRGQQALAPLFKFPSGSSSDAPRRSDIKKRQDQYNYTTSYWYPTTAALCKESGLWNYPITL